MLPITRVFPISRSKHSTSNDRNPGNRAVTMTGEAQAGIPPPLDNDDDDVAWALQTAAAQWKLAAFADAIVWLRRAVDSAIQAGHASRANELSGAAWRLTEHMLAQADAPAAPCPLRFGRRRRRPAWTFPAPPSGEMISVEFEATRTIPDTDTERSLTPSPPAGPAYARRTEQLPGTQERRPRASAFRTRYASGASRPCCCSRRGVASRARARRYARDPSAAASRAPRSSAARTAAAAAATAARCAAELPPPT